ncbi:cytochrome P450 716B1-like [Iris pallida]|uniref:Cytochrome P450 716B1-like n=1 Tax=Iris pallida TaxID=29817 RepID=A0AAX6E0R2_IRIPA|nr:cytochrome P450 716B1-like [Iris pallida]
MAILVLLFLVSLPIIIIYLLTRPARPRSRTRLPPGPLGIPYVGQSLGLLRAMWAGEAEEWTARRIARYGPVSKLTLFGAPTVLLAGPAANKFVFASAGGVIVPQQPKSISRLLGRRNMLELAGDDHRRVRGAVEQFLRPEVLKEYVGRMDEVVRQHIQMNWSGHRTIKVLPLAKSLTFDIICSLMVGIERGAARDMLWKNFNDIMAGMWAIPVNLPFTNFSKSLRASRRIREVLTGIVQERRSALRRGLCASAKGDLITYLISLRTKDDEEALTDEEIIDNTMLVMVAGHDTSSILITFIIRHLANDQIVRDEVIREQEEVANNKASAEDALTWDDILKMKYTWRVAMEVLRMVPPVFGSFRKTTKDIEYKGYLIPKGWQVFWTANATHGDATLFREPEKFDPSRFESQLSVPPYSFVAFGGGPRICPGNEFARLETLVMMHYVVTRFRWELCCKEDAYRRDPMPSPTDGLPIRLEPKTDV